MITEELTSSFLEGSIRHRRKTPVGHAFSYPIGLYGVRLAEWDRLAELGWSISTRRFNRTWFRRRDYFQPGNGDLDQAVRRHVFLATDWYPDGPIELVAHPRYFGWNFNPVSFYFCYAAEDRDADNPVPSAILAQITNTPWHERHTYCLYGGTVQTSEKGWRTRRFRFPKHFHVSPFNPMEQDYEWLFGFHPGGLHIHMNVRGRNGRVFDATLALARHPLNRQTLRYASKHYPAETIRASIGIHWNALRLWLKGARFHGHPGYAREATVPMGDAPSAHAETAGNSNYYGTVTSWKT